VTHRSWMGMSQPWILKKNLLYMKTKWHYFPTDSPLWQNFQLQPCSFLPACLHRWPASSLPPLRNRYSSNILCNTIHCLLVLNNQKSVSIQNQRNHEVTVKYLLQFQQHFAGFCWNISIYYLSRSLASLIVSICYIGFSCFVVFLNVCWTVKF
jgi:hypothetical protein